MSIQKIILAYFSPTHTSRNICRAVAEGCEPNTKKQELDATLTEIDHQNFDCNDLLIVSVPVYGGAVAPIALERLKNLRGQKTPAVVITVYGNRDFGKAPSELADFLRERNFTIIGAGAFVGEHSYSTDEFPIAAHRPNGEDLAEARSWGAEIYMKLKNHLSPKEVDPSKLKCPKSGLLNLIRFITFVLKFRRQMKKHPVKIVPEVNESLCNACGRCARECPTGAIPLDNVTYTDADKCIKCAKCVKNCPEKARVLNTPFGPALSKNFKKPKNNVTIL